MDRESKKSLDIVVCVKPVPDPAVILLESHNRLDRRDLVPILNPRDAVAVEAAVRLKEEGIAKSVTIVSISPASAERVLRRCLANGADRVIQYSDHSAEDLSSFRADVALAAVLQDLTFDLVLCGQRACDSEMGFTGYALAEQLGIHFIPKAVGLEVSKNDTLLVKTRIDGGWRENIEVCLPAVIGVELDLAEPRYAGLPEVIASLEKDIGQYDLKSLDLSNEALISKIPCAEFSPPRPRPRRLFIPDIRLSAPERLRLVMTGGMSEKKQALFDGSPEAAGEHFTQFLRQNDLLSF